VTETKKGGGSRGKEETRVRATGEVEEERRRGGEEERRRRRK